MENQNKEQPQVEKEDVKEVPQEGMFKTLDEVSEQLIKNVGDSMATSFMKKDEFDKRFEEKFFEMTKKIVKIENKEAKPIEQDKPKSEDSWIDSFIPIKK